MIARLSHVALVVPDLDRSVAFHQHITGLQVTERRAGVAYLSSGSRHHELVLIAGDGLALDSVGLEAYDATAFAALEQRVRVAGL